MASFTALWWASGSKIDHDSSGVTVATTAPSSGASANGRAMDEMRNGLSAPGSFTKVTTASDE